MKVLVVTLGVAVLQFLVPSWGVWKRDARAMAVGQSAAQVQLALVFLSYLCLTWAFVQKDFSVVYVADNSHSKLPLIYRISAVWGAHEGSLLLWGLMLSGWTLAVTLFNRRLPADLSATAIAVREVRGFVTAHGQLLEVIFACFSEAILDAYERELARPPS